MSLPQTPLHLASYYVEELKYGAGEGQLVKVTIGDLASQVRRLLDDAAANLTNAEHLTVMDEKQVLIDAVFYGRSNAEQMNVEESAAVSIFIDGVLHGGALVAGLRGEHRSLKGGSG